MRILALDLGTRLGWAALIGDRVEWGEKDFKVERGESRGFLFLKFRGFLCQLVSLVKPHLIICERPHLRGGYAADILTGMATRVEEKCFQEKIECTVVHSKTLKKISTGKGNATKEEMKQAAKKYFGHILDKMELTDNEADALLLLRYAIITYFHNDLDDTLKSFFGII